MKLINLDKLINAFEEKKSVMSKDPKRTIAEMMLLTKTILFLKKEAPSIAGIESNSEWVQYANDSEPRPWHCKNCNWWEQTAGYHAKFYNFCPDCGAKMKVNFEEKILNT